MSALGAREEPGAVALSLLFVAVGIGVLWFAKDVAELDEDAVLVSLLLLPMLLYLALSGRLAEVTGPGGVSAKFREAASAPAHSALKHLSPGDPFLEVPKMDLQMLRQRQPQLAADDRPIVFTFTLGAGGPQYGYPEVLGYTDVLAATGRFLLVAFLDADGPAARLHVGPALPDAGPLSSWVAVRRRPERARRSPAPARHTGSGDGHVARRS